GISFVGAGPIGISVTVLVGIGVGVNFRQRWDDQFLTDGEVAGLHLVLIGDGFPQTGIAVVLLGDGRQAVSLDHLMDLHVLRGAVVRVVGVAVVPVLLVAVLNGGAVLLLQNLDLL